MRNDARIGRKTPCAIRGTTRLAALTATALICAAPHRLTGQSGQGSLSRSGRPADIHARILAPALPEEPKQPFIVDDKPGAGGVIGTEAAASQPKRLRSRLAAASTRSAAPSDTQAINETLFACGDDEHRACPTAVAGLRPLDRLHRRHCSKGHSTSRHRHAIAHLTAPSTTTLRRHLGFG
ncbi:MAG: hypothetical protein JSR91_09790 [Proteobacteria bacterium]|nr:hypothetical protein [Pseudomonadota bacterium]